MPHQWDETGERCQKCGGKDWMGGPCDDDICTHEMVEFGSCVACGVPIEYDDAYVEAAYEAKASQGIGPIQGCAGRGWYHDGSEQEDAIKTGRIPKPCPYCK